MKKFDFMHSRNVKFLSQIKWNSMNNCDFFKVHNFFCRWPLCLLAPGATKKPSLGTEQQEKCVNAKRDSQPSVLVWLFCDCETEGRCRLVTCLCHILEVMGYNSIQRPDTWQILVFFLSLSWQIRPRLFPSTFFTSYSVFILLVDAVSS
jgi:hypothetical protein